MRALLLLFSLFTFLQAEPSIDISLPQVQLLHNHFLVFEDKTATLELEDVLNAQNQKKFQPLEKGTSSFGLSKSNFWIKIPLYNPQNKLLKRLLYFEYTLLDFVTLYTKDLDNTYFKTLNGDQVPISLHPKNDEQIIFPIALKEQSKSDLYIQVRSQSTMDLRVLMLSDEQYHAKMIDKKMLSGLFYGAALIMILYNLFLYFSIVERTYLYYVIFQTFSILILFTLSGLSFKYLWPELPYLNNCLLSPAIVLHSLTAILFTRYFLDTNRYVPRGDNFLRFLQYAFALSFIASLIVDYRSSIIIIVLVMLITMVTLIWVGSIIFFKYRTRASRYYLVAWSALLVFNLLPLLKVVGLLSDGLIVVWGKEIGVIWELLFLSFGLADRINVMRDEKEKHQKEAIEQANILTEVLSRSKEELKQKVKERTQALISTNEALEKTVATVKLLFKELNHRVKNNIQITIAMMLLQKKRSKEKAVHAVIDDNTMRLQSISTIHELLYKDSDTAMIDIQKYTDALLSTYQQNSLDTEVTIEKKVNSFNLDMDTAITVGLILNEVLTNIYKHAFTENDNNRVILKAEQKNNIVSVSIKDNGIGFDKKSMSEDTLGLILIEELSWKLNDVKLSYKKWHGSYFKLEFTNE